MREKGKKESSQISKTCTDEIPGENYIPNLKIYKQMLPLPNWPLNCVIF